MKRPFGIYTSRMIKETGKLVQNVDDGMILHLLAVARILLNERGG
ncbi:hypothetical protein BSM4216_1159 [Bacillus smithii]|nr:hypothetical protein BSM4216_1159 [Bacillus smithii]